MLVYLYGPPAVGKLTVARRLQELTGFRLFHNHLTVDAAASVFEFSSRPFADVVHRFRLDVFETAARVGTDVIFTNNSMWHGEPDPDAFVSFARQAADVVAAAGGTSTFVRLVAPAEVLCDRVGSDDRRAIGKLVDPDRLRTRLAIHDQPQVNDDDLVIDTSVLSVDDAARAIAAALNERG